MAATALGRVSRARFGGRCGEFHPLTGLGMVKGEQAGPEGDALHIPGLGAVFEIPRQRKLPGGKLTADLVGAAGQQLDAHQGEILPGRHQTVPQHRLPHAFARLGGHIGAPLGPVAGQQIPKFPFGGGRGALHHGQILLLEVTVGDLGGEQLSGHPGAGNYHHAADHLVQPMHRAQTGVLVFPVHLAAQQVQQPARLVGGADSRGLRQTTRRSS